MTLQDTKELTQVQYEMYINTIDNYPLPSDESFSHPRIGDEDHNEDTDLPF